MPLQQAHTVVQVNTSMDRLERALSFRNECRKRSISLSVITSCASNNITSFCARWYQRYAFSRLQPKRRAVSDGLNFISLKISRALSISRLWEVCLAVITQKALTSSRGISRGEEDREDRTCFCSCLTLFIYFSIAWNMLIYSIFKLKSGIY